MAKLPFFWIDAFSRSALGGNPCAVVHDADTLSVDQMQGIAREMNLSETAFVMSSSRADVRARYFTPSKEIPLAGHPTLAVMHSLIESGFVSVASIPRTLRLELEVGVVQVDLSSEAGDVLISMKQLKPEFRGELPKSEVAALLGLSVEQIHRHLPCQVVSTGTPMLVVPVSGPAALDGLAIRDGEIYRALQAREAFFSLHAFAALDDVDGFSTLARHPGEPPSGQEDPFTGSATGCMGAYVWHHGIFAGPSFTARQGMHMGRPGQARVTRHGDPCRLEAVSVAGFARGLIRGEIEV